ADLPQEAGRRRARPDRPVPRVRPEAALRPDGFRDGDDPGGAARGRGGRRRRYRAGNVNPFERLHPALQHHVVNSLGWKDLRPFQQAVIEPVLAARHLLVLAPTAGGKTEAALFPVLSRMLTDGWRGLRVLYVCPIKALLNNRDARLARYHTLLGRRSALWHGDIPPGQKKAILRDPPDCLLTTPESLEVMLVSSSVDARGLFSGLQVVIVD